MITASSHVHADLIEAAAGAGKAVFCEKPMGLTLAEIDRGIAAAEAAGVALQVGSTAGSSPRSPTLTASCPAAVSAPCNCCAH